MPRVPLRVEPTRWPLQTAEAVGSAQDFYVIAFSDGYDEHHAKRQRPLSTWTHILHFRGTTRVGCATLPDRFKRLWWRPPAPVHAIGAPEEIDLIDGSTVSAISLAPLDGMLSAIWGPNADHLFLGGTVRPFVYYRRHGTWHDLPMPEGGRADVADIGGFNERDVYVCGYGGMLLHFDGHTLTPVDVPTTHTLYTVDVLDDQRVCIGCSGGILLLGNRHGFRLVPSGTDVGLLSFGRMNGRIYYPSQDGLWSFDGQAAPQRALDQPFVWVSGLDDALVLTDGQQTYLFDGARLDLLDTELDTSPSP